MLVLKVLEVDCAAGGGGGFMLPAPGEPMDVAGLAPTPGVSWDVVVVTELLLFPMEDGGPADGMTCCWH